MKPPSIVLFAALALSASLTAQDFDSTRQGLLNGTVQVSPGNPLPGRAQVALYTQVHTLIQQTSTNASGSFSFHGVGAGNYLIVAKLAGYQDGTGEISIYKGSTVTTIPAIVLKPLPALSPASGPSPVSVEPVVSAAELRLNKQARAHYQKAKTALDKGNFAEAREHLERTVETEPNFADAYELLGATETLSGNYAKAQAAFEHALQLDSRRANSYFGLGKALNLLNRPADALVPINKGLELVPDSSLGLFEKSRAQFSLRDYSAAELSALASLHRSPPPPSEIHLVLANCYLRLRRYPEAATELTLYVNLEPNSTSAPQAQQTLAKLKKAGLVPK